jgi:serine/threonine protein kinase
MCSPGQQFGHYQLIRLVGQGGFAAVYLGEHRYLGTQAAIKILHTWLTTAGVRNFCAEARIAARLVHPHIIRVLDFGLEGEMPYLVMDYAPRGTLLQCYPPGSQLAPQVINNYVGQIADALQYIHDRGLIHRDIKPENLLLGPNNRLLLSDFGIAIATHKVTASSEQVIAGTIAYMAPEQIQGKPCRASDQYALGILTYAWLCGTLPFQGSLDDIAEQHLFEAPPSLNERVSTIPFAVEDVVFRALAKDPGQRYSSVREFAVALKEAFEYRSYESSQISKEEKRVFRPN